MAGGNAMRVTILGCGSSAGVPEIGCGCPVCTSGDPKNNRTRVSLFVEVNGINLLIDSSPDLRQQALRHDIKHIDAVLYTHDHADHTNGLDELRSFNRLSGDTIPVYGEQHTLDSIQERFPYAFAPMIKKIWFRPSLEAHALVNEPIHHCQIAGVAVTAFHQIHGKINTLGYRIGNFAYSTDCNDLPESAYEALKGTEIWVVDCLRYTESYSHSNFKRTLEWIKRVKPRLAILTHMAHEFDYHILSKELPNGVVPGYDGMILEL